MTKESEAIEPYSFLTSAVSSLRWITDGSEFRSAELEFAERVSCALRKLLGSLYSASPELETEVVDFLSRASTEAITNALMDPAVSHRLLWAREPAEDLARILKSKILSNPDRGETTFEPDQIRRFSKLGIQTNLGGGIVVDPDSTDEDSLGSLPPSEAENWTGLSGSERLAAAANLDTAYLNVVGQRAGLSSLIQSCVKVVVMRKTAKKSFCSFSSCYFVGRVTMTNPHKVDNLAVMEALVHEAIHSFLYMHCPSPDWGLVSNAKAAPGKVISPWTGREISLCAFLHACFVWYGILYFWGDKQIKKCSGNEGVRGRMVRASKGFVEGRLIDVVGSEDRNLVRPDVLGALEEIQDNVLALLD